MASTRSTRAAQFLLATSVVCGGATAHTMLAGAADRPIFSPPFECGERYFADSYEYLFWQDGRAHGAGPIRYAPVDFQQPDDADDGDPVLASAAGRAYRFDQGLTPDDIENNFSKGYVVIIDHEGDGPNVGWDSFYGHMEDASRIADGTVVARGDQVGVISDSASEPDDHLHYEQRLDGVPQLVHFDGVAIPYWLGHHEGRPPERWAPDAASQLEAATGSVGPWLTPPSSNCGGPDPTTTTTTTTVVTTTTQPTTSTTQPTTTTTGPLADASTLEELTHAVDFKPEHADVLRLYWAFFVRDPDVGGAKYWIGLYEQGVSLDLIASQFVASEEFSNRYGSTLSNSQYVSIVYENVLGRTADPIGFAYWLDLVETGQLGRGGVVRWIAANNEFVSGHPYPAD